MPTIDSFLHRNHGSYEELFHSFILQNPEMSWSRCIEIEQMDKVISEDRGLFRKNLSFLALSKNKPVAYTMFFVEEIEGVIQGTNASGFLPSPFVSTGLPKKYFKAVCDELFSYIDRLALENKLERLLFKEDPMTGLLRNNRYNELSPRGYIDATTATQVIDLSLPEEKLWQDVRKSYRHLIEQVKGQYQIEIYDYSNADYSKFEKYRLLHHKCAGRITRPKSTFDIMFDLMKRDAGILLELKQGNQSLAFIYCHHNSLCAIYGSAADDPDMQGMVGVYHALLWGAIQYYKERGTRYFELGAQYVGLQIFQRFSEKEIGIANFKKGFGGETVPAFKGIKYFTREAIEKDLRSRTELLFSSYPVVAG